MKILLNHVLSGEIGKAWSYFNSKEASGFIQFIKYGLAGGLAFLTHMIVFELMGHFVLPIGEGVDAKTNTFNSIVNYGVGFLFGNAVAYITNIKWVFVDGKFSRLTESLLFFAISGVSVIIGLVLMGFIEPSLSLKLGQELGPRAANLINIVTAVLINYTGRKFFLFKA